MASGGSHSDSDSDDCKATLTDLFLSGRCDRLTPVSNGRRSPRIPYMVWAKAFPYTWWPGAITRFTSTSASVSFFGCDGGRSRWFRLSDIHGFEEGFARFAKIGGKRIAGAVTIALDDLSRRTVSGLIANAQGRRSPDQEIESVIERFEPVKTLAFVRGLAISASVGDREMAGTVRMLAEVNAYQHFMSVGHRSQGLLGFDSIRLLEFIHEAAISVGIDEEEGGSRGSGFGDLVTEFRRFISVCSSWSYRPPGMDLECDLMNEEPKGDHVMPDSSYVDEIDCVGTGVSEDFYLCKAEMDSKATRFHDDLEESSSMGEICYDEMNCDGTGVSDDFYLCKAEMDSKAARFHDDLEKSTSMGEIGYDETRHLADVFSDAPAMEFEIIPDNLPVGGSICILNKADYSLLTIDEEWQSFVNPTQEQAAKENGSADQDICLNEVVVMQNLRTDLSTQEMDLEATCTLSTCCREKNDSSCVQEASVVSPLCCGTDSQSDNLLDTSSTYHKTQLGKELSGISTIRVDTDNQSLNGGGPSDDQSLQNFCTFCAKDASIVNQHYSDADILGDANNVAEAQTEIAGGNVGATCTEMHKDSASSEETHAFNPVVQAYKDCAASVEASAVNLPSSSADDMNDNVTANSGAEVAAQAGENLADVVTLTTSADANKHSCRAGVASSAEEAWVVNQPFSYADTLPGVEVYSGTDHIAALVEGLSVGNRSVISVEIETMEAKNGIDKVVNNEDSCSVPMPPLYSSDKSWKLGQCTEAYSNLSDNTILLDHSSKEARLVQNQKDSGTITFCNSNSLGKNCLPITKKRRCSESLKEFFKLHRSLAHSKEAKLYATLIAEYVASTAYEAYPYDEVIYGSNACNEASSTDGAENGTKPQINKRDRPNSPLATGGSGSKKRRLRLTEQAGPAESKSGIHVLSAGCSKWRKQYASPLTEEGSEAGSNSNKHLNCSRSLHMKFPTGFDLPSREEIEKKFRPFGKLERSRTRLFLLAGSAQVVFRDKVHAHAAFEYVKRKKLFGHADVSFWLDPYEAFRKRSICGDTDVLHNEPKAKIPRKTCAGEVYLQKERVLYMNSNISCTGTPDVHRERIEKMECQGSASALFAPATGHSSPSLKSCLRSAGTKRSGEKKTCKVRFRIETA